VHTRFLLVPAISAAALLVARDSRAIDAEVTSDTAAQFYDVRSPTGETILEQRRLTSTLGLGLYDLLGHPKDEPMAPEINIRARLRYDANYGASPEESDVTNQNRLVPGFYNGYSTGGSAGMDLMYAYLEGRRFLKGWLSFKLGRQYQTDVLGWWSFDGGEAKIVTPYYVAVEGYGGLEQRGGLPLSTSRFAADGVWRGDRTGYDPSLYPAFQPATIAPAFGAAIETAGVTWIHGRLVYRRVYDTGGSNVTEFGSALYSPVAYSGGRISSERLGYAMDANILKFGAVKAGFAYDFYNSRMTSIYGSFDAYLGQKVTASVDYDYYAPIFDGDSIWNFFLGEPMSDVGARVTVNPTDKLSVSAGAHTRITTVETSSNCGTSGGSPCPDGSPNNNSTSNQSNNIFPSNNHQFDEGGNLVARYKWGEGVIGLRSTGNFGPEGDRVGADINAQRVLETRYIFSGRLGVWQWDDKLRPDRDATDFNYVLGVGYRFAARSQTMLEWQHDVNRLVGNRFRLVLWLTFAVTK
jgi:hypothetical protein